MSLHFALSLCVCSSHRSSSSNPSPPPSVCAASSSECFQPPVGKTMREEKFTFVPASIHLSNPGYKLRQSYLLLLCVFKPILVDKYRSLDNAELY